MTMRIFWKEQGSRSHDQSPKPITIGTCKSLVCSRSVHQHLVQKPPTRMDFPISCASSCADAPTTGSDIRHTRGSDVVFRHQCQLTSQFDTCTGLSVMLKVRLADWLCEAVQTSLSLVLVPVPEMGPMYQPHQGFNVTESAPMGPLLSKMARA